MFLEYIQSASMIAGIFAGIAAFFWIAVTLAIRRLDHSATPKTLEEREEEMDDLIRDDANQIKKKRQDGLKAAS